MDIKERIEQVISEKGLSKKEVAERMGKHNQAINSLLTDAKWSTVELVAEAIGITTHELLFGTKSESNPAIPVSSERPSPADKLPFGAEKPAQEQPPLQPVAAFLCPHCGETIIVGLKK